MNNNVEKFLLNTNDNDKTFEARYGSKKIHKEKYDERFTIVYTKPDRGNSLRQENYEVAGYLDMKDKIIYDPNYDMKDLLSDEKSLIEQSSFSSIGEKIEEEIEKYIEKYSFEHEDELKNIAIEKYNHLEDYRKDSYKRDVREQFVEEDVVNIKLGKSYSTYELANSHPYNSKNMFAEYLNNPSEAIEKYSMIIIEKNDTFKNTKAEMGLELLIYYDKLEYLNKIVENEKGYFDDVYINKKIYQSIKDIDAKTLNITIKYGEKELTFKYDYNMLRRDLLNDSKGSNGYGAAYAQVSNFVKENTNNLESRRTEEFDFSHITSITYGKKELYKNDISQEKVKELDNDDFDVER